MNIQYSKVTLIIFLLIPCYGFSQYAFDVKTTMEEKADLQNYKEGLLFSITNSGWASIKDRGENYSLWLTGLDRKHINDSVLVSIIVELRTPAMFSRGKHIDGRQVWIKYHWEQAEKYALENPDQFNFDSEGYTDFNETLSGLSSTAGLITSMGLIDVSGLSSKGISSFINLLGGLMKRNPSPMELLESIYLGEQSLIATREMVKIAESN